MAKQRIRITESELRNLIRESIQEEIDNGNIDEGFLSNFGKIVGGDIARGSKNLYNKGKENLVQGTKNVLQKGKEKVGKIAQGAKDMYNQGKEYYDNAKERAQLQTNKDDAQRLLNDLKPFVEKGIIKSNIYNMIKGNLMKYINQ